MAVIINKSKLHSTEKINKKIVEKGNLMYKLQVGTIIAIYN